jgi:hypothetical protein
MPEVKSKAYVMLILSVFLDEKSSKYFPRKMPFKLAFFSISGCVEWGGGGFV